MESKSLTKGQIKALFRKIGFVNHATRDDALDLIIEDIKIWELWFDSERNEFYCRPTHSSWSELTLKGKYSDFTKGQIVTYTKLITKYIPSMIEYSNAQKTMRRIDMQIKEEKS